MKRAIIAALFAGFALCATRPAGADQRMTESTPYKLPAGMWRVGLWKVQYAPELVSNLEFGTYSLPWLAWIARVRLLNAHAKYALFDTARWAGSVGTGLFYVDFSNLDQDARVSVVPVEFAAAYRLNRRWTLTAGLMYSQMFGEGSYEQEEVGVLRGAVAASNVQSWLGAYWVVSRTWTVYSELRSARSVEIIAGGEGTVALDDYTTVEIVATGEGSADRIRGGSLALGGHWSRESFRMRAGLVLGNYNIPGINFVTPRPLLIPEVDVYWVF